MIKNFKKKSIFALVCAITLTILLSIGLVVVGSYGRVSSPTEMPIQTTSPNTQQGTQLIPWPSYIMADVPVTFEMAREIAITYAGISQPDVADINRTSDLSEERISWHFSVGGNGEFFNIEIDAITGDVINSIRFEEQSAWPIYSLPISFECAKRIAVDYVGVTEPFIIYFNGFTIHDDTSPVDYSWRLLINSHNDERYDIRVNAVSGEFFIQNIAPY
ncbi:MAG: PepSY domain-containing protein [Defluviitaleaceae bacterium]|nr:PepSY domain-containing protein [Defluviitaleaceae bacterium]MCL2239944.1 PepSY domain-containing protein [Defluviitaleaceae bacterium]